MIRAGLCLLLLPQLGHAGDLTPVPYDSLRTQPHRIETFDALPPTPEPGLRLDQHWRAPGLSIGERLSGQGIIETRTGHSIFDRIIGGPSALDVTPGEPGRNLTIAQHAGFGSNALFPVGPEGVSEATGRGEGSLALSFDMSQSAFGLRLHAEYADPFGQRPAPQTVIFTLYDRTAARITRLDVPLGHGVLSLAWRSRIGIAAITIETTDPGGIAIDDILYDITDLAG